MSPYCLFSHFWPSIKTWEQTTWWHCAKKKHMSRFEVFYRWIKKWRARCGSVLQATCLILKLQLFSTQLYEKPLWNVAQNMELKNWRHIMAQCQCNIYASYNILACRYNEVYIYSEMNTTKNPQHTLNMTLTRKIDSSCWKLIFCGDDVILGYKHMDIDNSNQRI